MTIPYADALEGHYTSVWGPAKDRSRLEKGPIRDLPDAFQVLVIPRPPDMTAYATRCMSQPLDAERLELHLFARTSSETRDDLVELLTAVAHFHRTGSALAIDHSVNFGRPWLPGSACTRGLICLPYLDGPRLEWMAEPRVRFLWLLPITEAELAFRKEHGTDALEARFEEAEFDYLDPLRASVV